MLHKGIYISLICAFVLGGCADKAPITLDSAEHFAQIDRDVDALYPDIEPASGGVMSLSLQDAIGRALRYNLDARVAAMETLIAEDNISLEQFKGMPNFTASGTFTRRNNRAASSSESVLTGTQSLEPSTSSEQARRLADIQAQWNVMDSVVAYLDGKNATDQAVTSKERLRKVQQNIERDVMNAYWLAYSGQRSESRISSLSKNIAEIERNIGKVLDDGYLSVDAAAPKITRLMQEQETLNGLYDVVAASKIRLKAMASLPMDTEIVLSSKPKEMEQVFNKTLLNKDIDDFIKVALKNRPELREQFMNQNIAVRDKEKELLKTFPGLNLIYSQNYDSNKYLSDNAWSNLSGAITQSITDFISLPKRYRAAENREELQNIRRQALTAAIIAQVHVGQIRVRMAQANYSLAKSEYDFIRRQARSGAQKQSMGAASGYDNLVADAAVVNQEIIKNQAYASLQQAYMDMMNALGLSIGDVDDRGVVL